MQNLKTEKELKVISEEIANHFFNEEAINKGKLEYLQIIRYVSLARNNVEKKVLSESDFKDYLLKLSKEMVKESYLNLKVEELYLIHQFLNNILILKYLEIDRIRMMEKNFELFFYTNKLNLDIEKKPKLSVKKTLEIYFYANAIHANKKLKACIGEEGLKTVESLNMMFIGNPYKSYNILNQFLKNFN